MTIITIAACKSLSNIKIQAEWLLVINEIQENNRRLTPNN